MATKRTDARTGYKPRLSAREAAVAARALRAYMAAEWGEGDATGETGQTWEEAKAAVSKLEALSGGEEP